MQVSPMNVKFAGLRHPTWRERGVALVTVLLFMVLVLILITSMLSVTGNEIVIAGLQRDGVRAMELAQTGLQEAIRRVEEGRPYMILGGFPSSLDPRVTITVTRRFTGTNSAYLELTATASNIGRATRRLSALVLQQMISFPPNIVFAHSVTESGSATISCGDAYADTFLQYKSYPINTCSEPPTITYAGWRVSKVTPGAVAPCYTNDGCVAANPGNPDVARWYPGTRRSTNETTALAQSILAFKAASEAIGCALPPGYNGDITSGSLQTEVPAAGTKEYGWDPDGAGPLPSQLDPDLFPCGLPYRWVEVPVTDEMGVPATPPTRWFKTIIFEQWLRNYWRFSEAKMTFVKRDGSPCTDSICLTGGVEPNLAANAKLGAVPPFPTISSVANNYDCKVSGGGVLNSLPVACTLQDGTPSTTDLGCKNPEMTTCSPTNPKVILLEGDWTINGTIGGHGTIIVNGNLTVNGTFDYWGTIMVNGTLQAGTGNVNIHGGLVALDTLQLIGNITVEGGGTVGGAVPTGRSNVIGKAWWER